MVEWRKIPGFPDYDVSDRGQVRSFQGAGRSNPPRILKTESASSIYPAVVLCHEGRSYCVRVHRLVLLAFRGQPPPGYEACHNNGNRSDARLSNLRWDTRSENNADRDRHGVAVKGERHGCAKLTEKQVLCIRKDRRVLRRACHRRPI